jgi:membrane dipeptidase
LKRRSLPSAEFAAKLRAQRVALVAWALPSDLRWIRAVPSGIAQAAEPAPGELPAFFRDRLAKMKAYVAASGLRLVLARADVDACLGGESGVVLASEGADFLEGRVADLGRFYDLGLRHVQLVHYIRNPIGDFQTVAPVHNGLSEAGRRLVEACNEKGVLVDLAHCSPAAVEQALAIAKKPVVWSHSWVDKTEGRWQDGYGHLQRRLSLEQAKRIAAKGGVVGLWGLGLSKPGPSRTPGHGNWTVARRDPRGYARELANLVRWLGADHVALGTDLEGVGEGWSVDNYDHVRSVIEFLGDTKLPSGALEKVAYGNYARVLKTALRT